MDTLDYFRPRASYGYVRCSSAPAVQNLESVAFRIRVD
jgi:hypothetical protein